MKRIILLLLIPGVAFAGPKKPPKPKIVEDKVEGKVKGHHWACPKGWDVAGDAITNPPIRCIPHTEPDPTAIVTGGVQ